ncbi:MAG: hypothetical protein ACI8Y7_000629 [Candidatus Woesearchaeota archaeon]|jgi:hypothetical protein
MRDILGENHTAFNLREISKWNPTLLWASEYAFNKPLIGEKSGVHVYEDGVIAQLHPDVGHLDTEEVTFVSQKRRGGSWISVANYSTVVEGEHVTNPMLIKARIEDPRICAVPFTRDMPYETSSNQSPSPIVELATFVTQLHESSVRGKQMSPNRFSPDLFRIYALGHMFPKMDTFPNPIKRGDYEYNALNKHF